MRFAALVFLAPILLSAQSITTISPIGSPATINPPTVSQQEVKPEDQCSVEGQILNAATSAPVKKASVMVMRIDVPPSQNSGMPPSYGATSDAVGKFALKGLDPGKYRINVMRNGFVSTSYGARDAGRPGTTLSLERGQTVKNIDMRLTPQGIVAGRILDEEGEPVPYVGVSLMRFRYQEGRKQLAPAGSASTNDLGDYRVFGIAPGKYYVSATARSAAMMGPSLTAADRTPQPEEDYLPTYYPGTLDTARAIQVDVGAGATVNGINLTLSKSRTVHVKGHVTNTALPGRRISVVMVPRNTGFFMGGFRSNQVDPKGNFDIRGVAPGAYYVYATLNEDGKTYMAKAPAEVAGSNVENIALTLAAGADIAGVMRVEGESTQDLANVYVRLQPRETGGMFMGGMAPSRPKQDRSFVLQNATADVFNVMVTGLPDGFYVKAIKWGEVDVLAAGLDAAKGAAQPLEIVVSPKAGEVKGSVQNSKTNQPAPGVTVVLVPQEKERREQSTFYRMTITDQHGDYTFQNLPPGDYKAFAWEDLEMGAYLDPEFMKPVEEKGEAVTVRESDRKSVRLTMIESEPRA